MAQASFDAWVKYYRGDENTPNATVSYYTKGALVALALDLSLRAGGQRHARRGDAPPVGSASGGPIDEADIAAGAAGRSAAARSTRELAAWVHGTGELPLQRAAGAAGVRLAAGSRPTLAQRSGLRVSEGALTGVKVKTVLRGGAAERAGVCAGDELLAVDGWRLRRLDDAPRLARRRARPFDLLLVRDQRLLRAAVSSPTRAAPRRRAADGWPTSASAAARRCGGAWLGRVSSVLHAPPRRRAGAGRGGERWRIWWLAQLPARRAHRRAAAPSAMPPRIEVAYVRELAQAAPPPAPAVVAQRCAAGRAPRVRRSRRRPPRPRPRLNGRDRAGRRPRRGRRGARRPGSPQRPAHRRPSLLAARSPAAASAESLAASAWLPRRHAAASAAEAFEWPPSTRLSYVLTGNYRGEVNGGAQVEWVRVGTRYQVHMDVMVGRAVRRR